MSWFKKEAPQVVKARRELTIALARLASERLGGPKNSKALLAAEADAKKKARVLDGLEAKMRADKAAAKLQKSLRLSARR